MPVSVPILNRGCIACRQGEREREPALQLKLQLKLQL